ncbi:MAG: hypothetical protein ACRAVC_09705 [Trichormus sp.]
MRIGHWANQFKIQNSKFKIKEFWALGISHSPCPMPHALFPMPLTPFAALC